MAKDKMDFGPDNCEIGFDDGGAVVIRFDPNADLGDSKTAKSRIVATTQGNRALGVPGTNRQIRVGLKVFAPKPKEDQPKTTEA